MWAQHGGITHQQALKDSQTAILRNFRLLTTLDFRTERIAMQLWQGGIYDTAVVDLAARSESTPYPAPRREPRAIAAVPAAAPFGEKTEPSWERGAPAPPHQYEYGAGAPRSRTPLPTLLLIPDL
ncbi:MAG: hypothetical protein LBQ81_06005 [Zoogloeaceae bacterium]|jgi:hypothetical protein|nr:hypothetical protein [Zoogloeaceae bacterium]